VYGLGDGIATNPANPAVPLDPCASQWAWSIPTCWQWPKTLIYGSNYPNPPAPPVVASTLPDGSAIPAVPVSGQAGSDTVQALTDAQIRAMQAGNQDFFENLNLSLQDNSIPWWYWAAGGAAVLALLFVGGSSPRRYGR
jgi:hypothetical protein